MTGCGALVWQPKKTYPGIEQELIRRPHANILLLKKIKGTNSNNYEGRQICTQEGIQPSHVSLQKLLRLRLNKLERTGALNSHTL